MGQVVSFVNNKGGVGKTSSACAIGLAWARMEKRILFIDLDSQANLTSIISKTDSFYQKWDRTIEDAFMEGVEGAGLPIEHTDNPLIDFVPSDLDLANFEKDTARASFKELLLFDLLQPVKDKYDYIIIDCPPNLSVITYNAMIASDYLVMVTHAEGSSSRGLEMIVSLYNEIVSNKRFNPQLVIIGCIVTRYEKNEKVCRLIVDLLEKSYGEIMLKPYVPKSTKVAQSTTFGKSIFDVEQEGGKVTEAYLKLSKEIIYRIVDDQKGKE